jgi:hypothetical protein
MTLQLTSCTLAIVQILRIRGKNLHKIGTISQNLANYALSH